MKRRAREDWLDAGVAILRKRGHDALTIETLCLALERTKGSFYHHFTDASAFATALLEHWEQRSTNDLIAVADAPKDASPEVRRARLYASVRNTEASVERAIQAWALRDPIARAVRARVDQRRVAYLAELRRAAGVKPKLAQRIAEIEYSTFLGGLSLYELPDAEGWKAFEKANALLQRALEEIQRQPTRAS